ncbi:hypothetical protein [Nocardiopsis eucommiae]|uniref:hypothetical protein n=1 Tax=Nocardiopsis eucommiae TaxID=2831970 RepID=UPI003D75A64A
MRTPEWDVERALDPWLLTAVPELRDRPRAAARIGWRIAVAMLRARSRGGEPAPLALSWTIPFEDVEGLLRLDTIRHVRGLQALSKMTAPDFVLEERLEYLRAVGPDLPVEVPR